MRRPRSDSKLETLSQDQKQQLCEWLLTPTLAVRVIKKRVADEFQIETSQSALSRFHKAYCAAELLRRRAEAVSITGRFRREIKRAPGEWDEPTIDVLKQKCFEMAACHDSKSSEVKNLFSLVLKSRDQDLYERKIRILEAAGEKVAKAEAAAAEEPKLSPEDRQRRMKEILGTL